jgi:hypothetical protein
MPQPPKFEPRRRNPRAGPMQLPAEGRRGRAPSWPLEAEPKAEQRRLWAKLWRTPQAVAWERLGWTRVVARYVLVVIEAEGELDSKLLAQAVALEDRLGLTPKAMRLLLWEVVADEVAAQRRPVQDGRYDGLSVADLG